MARRRGSTRTRRQFEWARSNGFLVGTVATSQAYGAVDLLADARTRWGNAVFRGATVSSVRGWIRPNVANNTRVSGRAAIRVASYSDIAEVADNAQEAPYNDGAYEDWMGFFPYDVFAPEGFSLDQSPATFNPANDWAVETHSSRKLDELGYTLGLFFFHANVYGGGGADVQALDYDLSIGLKMA